MKALSDIGLVGLAVMGENLILNMESKGFTVTAYNRSTNKVDGEFVDVLWYRNASNQFLKTLHRCGIKNVFQSWQRSAGCCAGDVDFF